MLSVVLFLVGMIINVFLSFWIVSIKINALKKERSYIDEIRAEMTEFMAALEENVAGYVQLMEKMRKDADNVMESVNRKLRIVEKETQKLEQSRQTYNDLSRRKPLVSSVVDIQKQKPTESPAVEINRINSTSTQASGMQDLTYQLRGATQHMHQSQRSQEQNTPSAKPKKGSAKEVAMLWRDGNDAKEIAEKLNLSLGEVELALELMGSRRS